VKYPYARGVLLDLWDEARKANEDPVAAWASIVNDPEKRRQYQMARGKGGFRRTSWDEAVEIIAAATIHTIKTYGPDRVFGFSPIPAMSQVSYIAGSRFLTLLGGVMLSFYDWYADLPPASPEVWGEQTDAHESADWYNARFIAVVGSNVLQTRSPDAHFLSEARHAGAKVAVFSSDFSPTAKMADWWIPIHLGEDAAFWLAVDHVILKECYADRAIPQFVDYLKRYTDSPFLVEIKDGRLGRCLRAKYFDRYKNMENGDWKLVVWDKISGQPRSPDGTIGYRWAEKNQGKWNLQLKDGETNETIDPDLTFIEEHDTVLQIELDDFAANRTVKRGIPVRYAKIGKDRIPLTTIFDLIMAQFGVARGLPGEYGSDYYDENALYTPAWQEKYTGVHRETVIRFAREWAENAEKTQGRNLIIIGMGANHWYHGNLNYRAAIAALMLTGSVGKNGGGLAHYSGQERVANLASWSTLAFAGDWKKPPRQQNTPSFHYVHSDQWRYERGYSVYDPRSAASKLNTSDHTIDHQARAVRRGWLPFYPQFNKNSLELAKEAQANGAKTDQDIVDYVTKQLVNGRLGFSVEDPDSPENWPRVWFIWRANAIGSSAKGHEYFLKHYLGTQTSVVAPEMAKDYVKEVRYRDEPPTGKLDLVVDADFRMATSALYSDLVLPAATWYEKDDINTTDLHSYLHPMQEAVPPVWESKSDWELFKAISKKVSELAKIHLPRPVKDVLSSPLAHDTPDELAQPDVTDWKDGKASATPGKTMPRLRIVERDYVNLYDHLISLGKNVAETGVTAHGITIPAPDVFTKLLAGKANRIGSEMYPSLETARQVAEVLLALDPVANGELAYKAFQEEKKRTGIDLTDLSADSRHIRYGFDDIVKQPCRYLTSPVWSGILNEGRSYSPFTQNIEKLVPWRTLTGRQHFYLDHPNYLAFGESMPTFKLVPDYTMLDETSVTRKELGGNPFAYITPHAKWSIHSTYSDTLPMMTLSRGDYPVWINDKDAEEMLIHDNDWVELANDNGVFVQRCITSARIPRGAIFVYHATERTISIPKSPLRGHRAGIHSSCIRVRLKPVLMSGGYAQQTYAFNYIGPTGISRDAFVYIRRLTKVEY
jgi:nitrate reductase alpha subunit